MDNIKRAIVLDMDETLEHGEYGFSCKTAMILRPNLDKLITKLREAKEQGVDVILCTTAGTTWVERFLNLKPELREIFNRVLTRDNEDEWKNYNKDENPEEYNAQQQDFDLCNLKPVTTFGYDSVLFIDDNKTEYDRLQRLYQLAQGRLNKEVVYFRGFGFYGGGIGLPDYFRI